MKARKHLPIVPLLLLVLSASAHAFACQSDLHQHEELFLFERGQSYVYDRAPVAMRLPKHRALLRVQSALLRELKRLGWRINTITALARGLVEFMILVRNWYVPLYTRLSPFAPADAEVRATMRNGLTCTLRPKRGDMSILNEVFCHDQYAQWSPVSGTVIDLGAHIGIFALSVSSISDTVICYEPHPYNFELLQKNIAINGLNNVTAIQHAVSGEKGVKKLSVFERKSYGHTFYPPNGHDFVDAINVESVTLADVFDANGLEHIDYLKMHCEGADYDILAHAPLDVLDRIGVIFVTYSHDGTKIADMLSSRGFVVTWGHRSTLCAVNGRKDGKQPRRVLPHMV